MKKKIIIEGMNCKNCVAHVTEAITELKDSSNVEVNLAEGYATVETSESDEVIKNAIEDAGYDVIGIE